jgi:ABC-type Fe3+/spermidine/putrescine transport system ATPase subunit
MLAGLEEISGGEILIDDKVVNDLDPRTATSRWSSRATRCTRT